MSPNDHFATTPLLPTSDSSQWSALYAEFADEDRAMAEAGMTEYSLGLAREDVIQIKRPQRQPMAKEYTSVEEQVEYGLETVNESRSVEVPLRDLLYVYKTIGEFVSYFHNPSHYPNMEAVEAFVGNSKEGALHLLWECYYRKLRDVWPPDVQEDIEEGHFAHPQPPFFFKPSEDI